MSGDNNTSHWDPASVLNRFGLLEGLLFLEREKGLILNKNLFLRYWYHDLEPVLPYFSSKKTDSGIWELFFSFTSWDRYFNLLSFFPPDFIGETEENQRQDHKKLINFLELLNTWALKRVYDLWKTTDSPSFLEKAACVDESCLEGTFGDSETTAAYYKSCRDIILEIPARCSGHGIDRAHLQWGIGQLLNRITFPLRHRLFTIQIKENIPCRIPVISANRFKLNASRLGTACIGKYAHDPWHYLQVQIVTDSWEVYLLFAPHGDAHTFLNKVLEFWLGSQKLGHKITVKYTGERHRFGFFLTTKKRKGFGLGYTSFSGRKTGSSQKETIPDLEACERCFDQKPLLRKYDGI